MKTLILIALILSTSCTTSIKSPVTQIEYMGYINQEGVGVTVKPPFWQGAVELYKRLTDKEEKDE